MTEGKLPEFKTKRLFLRGTRLADAKSYKKHFVNYEVIQYLRRTVLWPYPEGGVKDFFRNEIFPKQGKNHWHWSIFLREKPKECIGGLGLWRKACPENRGFWLSKKYHGKGLMTEAVQPVLNYAFNELGFNKLIFSNAVQNKASRRVKEKTGCRYIKKIPQKFVNPNYREAEIWELTKKDWLKFYNAKDRGSK